MVRLTRMVFLAAVALVGFAATSARAGLLPVNVSVNPEGDNFRWTYNIVLPTDSQLRSGDYFTIYDFGGLVSTSNVQPDGWTFATSNTGPVPTGVDPHDSADLPNLTWTYSGPTIGSGQIGLGNFWAVSKYQDSVDSFFTATTHRTADGRVDANITDTTVPVPTSGGGGTTLTPEPTTLVLAGLGLPLLGVSRLRRKK